MNPPGSVASNGFANLAGHFVLQPGQPSAIVGTRPITTAGLLSQLLRGQHLAATQTRLGHVFTLCGHAHQRTCALAFDAAWPQQKTAALPLALLRWETARDHLRCIALEWPQRLGEPSLQGAAMNWLRTCPLPLTGSTPPSAAEAWASLAALRHWLQQDASFPAQCLARWQARGKDLAVPLRALDVLSHDASTQQAQLRGLGQAIASSPDFTRIPQWQGACAETGPWTRRRHTSHASHTHQTAATQPVSAQARLEARWQELREIAAAPALADDATDDPLLGSGALALADGQAIAWCEMARGLLLHWVQLDSHGAVAQYRVIAPTEWNFHPHGALAQALAALGPQDAATTQTLAAAFDPCVECRVAAPPVQETAHA
jgi:hypothetical protein